MDSPLNSEDRARLRLFLRKRFEEEELKDLAFDLEIPLRADIKVAAIPREIIEHCERHESLSCLIKEVILRRRTVDTSELGEMLAKLPPCKKRAKVQVIVHGADKELLDMIAKLKELAGTRADEIDVIGAAPGSIHLLISLPEAGAESLLKFRRGRALGSQYIVESVKNFEALTYLAQITWRVLVVYSPFSGLGLWEAGLSWRDAADLVIRGRAAAADTQPDIPQPALFNYYGGLLLLRVKNWESAVHNFSRSLEIMPRFAEAHLRRGIAYYHLGQLAAALADYDAAIKYVPGLAEAYNYRGALHAKAGEYNKALADFDQALRLSPGSSISYTNRGSVFYLLRQYRVALADFNRAVSLDPSNKRAYVCRGFTLTKLRRYGEALSDFNRSIELDPDDAQLYVHRGIIYERIGRNEDARLEFEAALRLDPDNERARRIMQELNAAADKASSRYADIADVVGEAGVVDDWTMAGSSSSAEHTFGNSLDVDVEE
jgi:tetratricopeptide (TPR) repeat protein